MIKVKLCRHVYCLPSHNTTGSHGRGILLDRYLHAGGLLHGHQELHVRSLGRHEQGWLVFLVSFFEVACFPLFPLLLCQLGTTLAPFVVDLGGEVHSGLPIAVFGGLMIVAAVTFLFAPETRGRPMAQNIRDLESRDLIQHWTQVSTPQSRYPTFIMKISVINYANESRILVK